MNFKILQNYPSPTEGLNPNNTLIHVHNLNYLILYGGRKTIQ